MKTIEEKITDIEYPKYYSINSFMELWDECKNEEQQKLLLSKFSPFRNDCCGAGYFYAVYLNRNIEELTSYIRHEIIFGLKSYPDIIWWDIATGKIKCNDPHYWDLITLLDPIQLLERGIVTRYNPYYERLVRSLSGDQLLKSLTKGIISKKAYCPVSGQEYGNALFPMFTELRNKVIKAALSRKAAYPHSRGNSISCRDIVVNDECGFILDDEFRNKYKRVTSFILKKREEVHY